MNKVRSYYFVIAFAIVLFIAFFIRLYKLNEFPVGFHIDEASLGYNGYSLLKTGRDDNNNLLPLYIDIFGDNRPSGYHYLTIIPIILFGLSEFSTRLPGAVFGALTVVVIYLFSHALFKNKYISLLCAFFIAVAPWSVVLSRASAEAIVALFFILLGSYFLILSINTKRSLYSIIGTIFLSLSYFFYHTPRIFVPTLFFVFLSYVLYARKELKKKFVTNFALLFFVISLLSFSLVFLIGGGTGRFKQVNIFQHPEVKLVMAEQIREDGTAYAPFLSTRLIHNKIVNYASAFFTNYLDYFSGSFLFIKGGLPIWYVTPNMGLIYLYLLPFILFGAFSLLKHQKILYKLPIVWILIAPITAAVTVDDIPNINRAIVLFPMLEVVGAYGLYQFFLLFQNNYRKIAFIVISLLFIFQLTYFIHQYFVHQKTHRTWYRDNGFKAVIDEVKKSYASYDKILITKSTGGLYPLVLFYMQYDPKLYQKEGSPKDKEYTGFGKFFFVPQACPSSQRDDKFPIGKVMYIERGECSCSTLIKTCNRKQIYREDGTPAYNVVYE